MSLADRVGRLSREGEGRFGGDGKLLVARRLEGVGAWAGRTGTGGRSGLAGRGGERGGDLFLAHTPPQGRPPTTLTPTSRNYDRSRSPAAHLLEQMHVVIFDLILRPRPGTCLDRGSVQDAVGPGRVRGRVSGGARAKGRAGRGAPGGVGQEGDRSGVDHSKPTTE